MTITPETATELEATLVQLQAEHPGLTNEEAAKLLPRHLVGPLWERAIDSYFAAALTEEATK